MGLNTVRIFYDLPDKADFDSHSIEVYELASPKDVGTLIDTVRVTPGVDYIETEEATSQYSWFKLRIKNADSTAFSDALPVLGEKAFEKIYSIREAVNDTNLENPAFSDVEIMNKIRLSAMRLNAIKNISSIAERFWPIIELLVRIDICNVLAFDFAKYLKLEIPGGPTLSKDELYKHYIEVAKALEEYYSKIKADAEGEISGAGDGDTSIGAVTVSDATRMSYETGLEETSLDPVQILDPMQGRADFRDKLLGTPV